MANIILGGGIGGLSAAYYLSKCTQKGVRILEASERFGGWIRTSKTENGTIFEQGPRTIRPSGDAGKNTLKMVEDLGLGGAVRPVLKSHAAATNRLVYVGNKLHLLPNSLAAMFKVIPPFSKPLALSLLKDLVTPRKQLSDESVYDFVERRLGRELADFAISPMICGIYAGDAKEISVKSLMKQLFEAEQKHGGIVKGFLRGVFRGKKRRSGDRSDLFEKSVAEKWSVWSLEGGLETLPLRLAEYLHAAREVEASLNAKVTGVELQPGRAVVTVNGTRIEGERLFCSLPSHELARLLGPEHPVLREELSRIPFVTVAVVNLEFEGKVLQEEGFGFLVPPQENLPILGVIFDTCCFPQSGKTVLTVMMGGRWFEQQLGSNPSPAALEHIARSQVNIVLGISQPPSSASVSILNNCIPQYVIGHQDRVDRVRRYLKDSRLPLSLVGSSYDGVGVNDVILSARNAVHSLESLAP